MRNRKSKVPPLDTVEPNMNAERAIEISRAEKRTVVLYRREHLAEGLSQHRHELKLAAGRDEYHGDGWQVHLVHVAPPSGTQA